MGAAGLDRWLGEVSMLGIDGGFKIKKLLLILRCL